MRIPQKIQSSSYFQLIRWGGGLNQPRLGLGRETRRGHRGLRPLRRHLLRREAGGSQAAALRRGHRGGSANKRRKRQASLGHAEENAEVLLFFWMFVFFLQNIKKWFYDLDTLSWWVYLWCKWIMYGLYIYIVHSFYMVFILVYGWIGTILEWDGYLRT